MSEPLRVPHLKDFGDLAIWRFGDLLRDGRQREMNDFRGRARAERKPVVHPATAQNCQRSAQERLINYIRALYCEGRGGWYSFPAGERHHTMSASREATVPTLSYDRKHSRSIGGELSAVGRN